MSKIKVFTTPVCPYCVTLKEFLKSENIAFEEIDVSVDLEAQKEMVEKIRPDGSAGGRNWRGDSYWV